MANIGLVCFIDKLMEIISIHGLLAWRCFSIEKNNGTMSMVL
jgi:hypothetical protein